MEKICRMCQKHDKCTEKDIFWCRCHDNEDFEKDTSLPFCENCIHEEMCAYISPYLDACDNFLSRESVLGESEWDIQTERKFYSDPIDGYSEWDDKIISCKNCGKKSIVQLPYCPYCGKKMKNAK